jgi:hypothetical protein
MAALEQKAAEAVESYVRASAARRSALNDIRDALTGLDPIPDVEAYHRQGYRAGVRIGDATAMPERPQAVLSRIVRDAYRKYYPREQCSFDSPKD